MNKYKPTYGTWINTNMVLLNYFKKSSFLPNPNGPLSEQMPSSSIALANRDVQNLLNDENFRSKRCQYAKYSEYERAKVVKRASEMGVTNLIRFLKKEFANCPLKESTVCTWKSNMNRTLSYSV